MADTGEHLPKGKTVPEVAKAEKSGGSERGTQVGKRVKFGDNLEELFPKIDEQPEIKSMNIKLTPGEEKTLGGNRRGPEEKKFSVLPLTYDQIVEGMLSVGVLSKILNDELYDGNEALLTSDDISKKYKKKSVHPCRVLHYSPIERMYICSLIKDKLESDECHVQQATCGKVVTCKIVRINKEGACVQFGSGMHGFIPNSLLKNDMISEAAKEKLVGTSVKARIMERDTKLYKLVLKTHKELVASKGAVIPSVEEAEIGMKERATLRYIDKDGAYVSSIEGVEVVIPASKLHGVRLVDFEEARITEYKVLEKVPEKNHLLLTAIIDDEEETVPQQSGRKEKRKLSVNSDSDAQKEMDFCRKLLIKTFSDFPSATKVFIITTFALFEIRQGHRTNGEEMFDRVLTQYPQRIDIWLLYVNALIKAGDNDETRTVFHLVFEVKWSPRKLKLLLKRFQSFENEYGDDLTKAEFQNCALKVLSMSSKDDHSYFRIMEEAEIGMNGYAIIKSFNKEGVNVNAIGGVKGFIPVSKLNRVCLADFKEAHHVGQIIEYKVLEKVPEKNHLLLTAIIDDEEEEGPQKRSGRKEKREVSVYSDSDTQKENGEESRPSKKKKKKTKSDTSISTSPYDPSHWLVLIKGYTPASQLVVADLSSKSKKEGEPKKVPKFVSKFESGEIKSPKDPSYWLDLVTHYYSVGNADKARGVAKQALSSMDYRNDRAKLIVWGSLLYNEAVYGTEESITTALADALQTNEEVEYLKMICLVYGTLHLQKRWLDFRRKLLSQALSDVPNATKVFIITTFALFEIRQGHRTNGEEMFDRVLAQYPHRIDIWLLYVNALIKAGDNDKTRSVFHRAFEVKWSPRKVKPLLQRFESFENEYGDDLTKAEFQNCALKGLSMSSKD